MSLFTTTVNAVTTYRVRLKNNETSGTNWRYNWISRSSKYPGVDDFYALEGVDKENESEYWTLNPYANFVFNRITEVDETFNVYVTVKIFNGNVETCEQILVASVTVLSAESSVPVCDTDFTILDVNTGLPVDCVVAGTDYLYEFGCELGNPVDSIVWNAKNARVFSPDGVTEYTPGSNVTLTPDVNNKSQLRIRWSISDPDSNGFKLTAYGVKSGKFSNITTRVYKVPYTMGVAIQGSSEVSYGGSTYTYPVNITGLNRFSQTYKIQYQAFQKFSGESVWTNIYTSPIFDLSTVNTTGTVNGQFTFTPGAYTEGAPGTVELKESVFIYKYEGPGSVYNNSPCKFYAEDIKTVNLVYCISTIPKGVPTFTKPECTTTIERNDGISFVKTCTESDITTSICKPLDCLESSITADICKPLDCLESDITTSICKPLDCLESGITASSCLSIGSGSGPTGP